MQFEFFFRLSLIQRVLHQFWYGNSTSSVLWRGKVQTAFLPTANVMQIRYQPILYEIDMDLQF